MWCPGISHCEVGEISEAAARPESTAKVAEDYFCKTMQVAREIVTTSPHVRAWKQGVQHTGLLRA